ncbi:MAG: FadR/GntR family transcriptional regulator [Chloroflexota bacterium]
MAKTIPLQTLRRQNLSEHVVDEVIKFIFDNGLREGDALPGEREMCEQLGVSRSPLREGLRALQVAGAVDIRHGKGAFVGHIDIRSAVHHRFPEPGEERESLLDLLEIRATLELAALRLAMPRLTPEHLRQLDQYLSSAAIRVAHGESPVEEDVAFHEVFFIASQNRVLIGLAQALHQPLRRARELYFARVPADKGLIDRHQAVYDALLAGDHDGALKSMSIHLKEATDAMVACIVLPNGA